MPIYDKKLYFSFNDYEVDMSFLFVAWSMIHPIRDFGL